MGLRRRVRERGYFEGWRGDWGGGVWGVDMIFMTRFEDAVFPVL